MLLQLNAEAGSGDPEHALSCAAKVKFIFTLTGKFIRYTSPVSGWDDLSFIMCALIINMLSNNPQAGCGVETMHICSWGTQSFPKKRSLIISHHHRQGGFMLSHRLPQIQLLSCKCHSRNQGAVRPGDVFACGKRRSAVSEIPRPV